VAEFRSVLEPPELTCAGDRLQARADEPGLLAVSDALGVTRPQSIAVPMGMVEAALSVIRGLAPLRRCDNSRG